MKSPYKDKLDRMLGDSKITQEQYEEMQGILPADTHIRESDAQPVQPMIKDEISSDLCDKEIRILVK